jgi:hypothetical protein
LKHLIKGTKDGIGPQDPGIILPEFQKERDFSFHCEALSRRSRDDYRFLDLGCSERRGRFFGEEQEVRFLGISFLFPFLFSSHRTAPIIGIEPATGSRQKKMSVAVAALYGK